jgi:hypothetical protein
MPAMTQVPEFYHALAEAVSPLSHSLAAGLLIRPVPARAISEDREEDPLYGGKEAASLICYDLDKLLKETVPLMKQAMQDLESCEPGDLEELVDELASPALDLVDMARRIWETPFPPEAEGARALLATLAEAPVTQVLQWVLEVMHTVIDPWSVTENPEHPDLGFTLIVPDNPIRDALSRWRAANPGILPEEVLR